jgi:GT2 family glycosyltransferase
VVAFESSRRLARLYESLCRELPHDDWQLVVVDNSPQSSDDWIAQYPHVHYIVRSDNPGFGVAANEGMKIAHADSRCSAILLVNPDAYLYPGFGESLPSTLAKANEGSALGALCPKVLLSASVYAIPLGNLGNGIIRFMVTGVSSSIYSARGKQKDRVAPDSWSPWIVDLNGYLAVEASEAEGLNSLPIVVQSDDSRLDIRRLKLDSGLLRYRINNAGSSVFSTTTAGDVALGDLDVGQFDQEAEVQAFMGGAVIVLPRLLDQVGMFDESFFLYYEDIELSLRAGDAGLRFRYAPELVMLHDHSASTMQNPVLRQNAVDVSRTVFAMRTAGPRAARAVVVESAIVEMLRVVKSSRTHSLVQLPSVALHWWKVARQARAQLSRGRGARSLHHFGKERQE